MDAYSGLIAASELDLRIRSLEAERLRPTPPPPPLRLMDLDEVAAAKNRQELEEALAGVEDEEVEA